MFRLTRELLAESRNEAIQEFVEHRFVHSDRHFSPDYSPAEQLRIDIFRVVKLNNLDNQDPVFLERISGKGCIHLLQILIQKTFPHLTENEVQTGASKLGGAMRDEATLSRALFSLGFSDPEFISHVQAIRMSREAELVELLDEQFPGMIDGTPCSTLLLKYFQQNPQYHASSPFICATLNRLGIQAEKKTIKLFSCVEEGKHKVYYETDDSEMSVTCLDTDRKIFIQGTKWRFELTSQGFEFVEAYVNDPNLYKILMGDLPRSLETFEYAAAYARAPISSPLKFVTEFLPHCIEITAKWAADKLYRALPNEDDMPNTVLRGAARAGMWAAIGLADVIYVAAKTTRLLISCVTSPIRSYNEARARHPLLGYLSAAITVAGIVALSVVAAPLFSALGLNAAGAWLIAHTGPVGAFMQSAGMHIAAAFSETVVAGMAGAAMMGAVLLAATLSFYQYLQNSLSLKTEVKALVREKHVEGDADPAHTLSIFNSLSKGLVLDHFASTVTYGDEEKSHRSTIRIDESRASYNPQSLSDQIVVFNNNADEHESALGYRS